MAGLGAWLRGFFGGKEESDTRRLLPLTPTQRSGPESFAEDNNDFALAMYRQLRQRPGNLFFSPFRLRTVLGMTYAGARGETIPLVGRLYPTRIRSGRRAQERRTELAGGRCRHRHLVEPRYSGRSGVEFACQLRGSRPS